MKGIVVFKKIALASLASLCIAVIGRAVPTEQVYLSGTGSDHTVAWDFFCTGGHNSGRWSHIAVPSCWELQGFGAYNYGRNSEPIADEQGHYRYRFNVPARWKGMRVQIVFEGSMTDTEIRVNGEQAGEVHQGSFYRFKRDITDLVKYGKRNLLEVTVSKRSSNASVNAAERYADFWVFGGIYRPVYLEVTPMLAIEHLTLNPQADGHFTGDVMLSAPAPDAAEMTVVLRDLQGNPVGQPHRVAVSPGRNRIGMESHFADIRPWSSEYPNLYRAEFTLSVGGREIHTASERIGFRTVEFRPHDGIYVNGCRMIFRGVNRGSIYPTSGRTTNRQLSLQDAQLIKEMNMNAVRMSHYPPDKHFLDVCDSLGLYVMNELCAWQSPPYDDEVGSILAREMLWRDLNHPCVVVWANGNEGGFNFNLDPIFDTMDLQRRPVIHPWSLFRGINTQHYISYNAGLGAMYNGRDVFMPTELIHGLYDGGHGAGLDDYWNLMRANPLSAGMFLWDFADQGVVRTDQGGVLDTWTHYGADGIVGPYREKEGSFYTVKEIWSPVYVAPKVIAPGWDGRFMIENRFDETDMAQCSFTYRLVRYHSMQSNDTVALTGRILAPAIAPGNRGFLQMELPAEWEQYDVLYLTTRDHTGRELFTYSYEITHPHEIAERFIAHEENSDRVSVEESASTWIISSGTRRFTFDRSTGYLAEVCVGDQVIPLKNGPRLVADFEVAFEASSLEWNGEEVVITTTYRMSGSKASDHFRFVWTVRPGCVLDLSFSYRPKNNFHLLGVTFDLPEEEVTGVRLFARGPYRIYKNRMKGGTINLWEKPYNNTITGESWDYPEFKGFYANLYGVKIDGANPFTVLSHTQDIFLHLFTPEIPKGLPAEKYFMLPVYPEGDFSFLHAVSAMGTKFRTPAEMGPQSAPHLFQSNANTAMPECKLTFLF